MESLREQLSDGLESPRVKVRSPAFGLQQPDFWVPKLVCPTLHDNPTANIRFSLTSEEKSSTSTLQRKENSQRASLFPGAQGGNQYMRPSELFYGSKMAELWSSESYQELKSPQWELLETELEYIEKLSILDHIFIIPLLSSQAYRQLFLKPAFVIFYSILQSIITLNQHFSKELREVVEKGKGNKSEQKLLATLFQSYTKRFQIYAYYATYYDLAMDLISDAKRFSTELESHIKKQEDLEVIKEKRLNFQNLMIEPIQRLPRYKLLIREMIKAIENKKINKFSTRDTLEKLSRALSDITDVLKHINEAVRLRERRLELRMFVQDNFFGRPDLIRNCRSFVHCGNLTKNRRTKKPYKFFLFSDILVYGDEALKRDKVNVHRVLPRENMVVTNPEKESLNFMIKGQSKAFEVIAPDRKTKEKWLDLLDKEVRRGLDNARNKELAPIWQPDQDQETCTNCEKKFSIRNRRHHCRVCGILICAACSTNRRIVPWLNPEKKKRLCDSCCITIDEAKGKGLEVDESKERDIRVISRQSRGRARKSTFNSNKAGAKIKELTVEFSRKLESFLDMYGRTIFDSLVDEPSGLEQTGNNTGNRGSRKMVTADTGFAMIVRNRTHKARLQITLALFLQTVEMIRFFTDRLQYDFVKQEGLPFVSWIGKQYTVLWSCFPDYYSRLPESLIIFKGIRDPNPTNALRFKDLTGHETIEDFLFLPRKYLKEVLRLMGDFSKKLDPMEEKDYKLAFALITQALSKCDAEMQLGENRVELRDWQQNTGASFFIQRRGRKLLKEGMLEKSSLSATGATRMLKFWLFNDTLVYRSGQVKKIYRLFWLNESQVSEDMVNECVLLFTNRAKSFKIKFKNVEQKKEWQKLLSKDHDWWMIRRETLFHGGLLEEAIYNDFCAICYEEFSRNKQGQSFSELLETTPRILTSSAHDLGTRKEWPKAGQTACWRFASTKKFQCSCCELIACDVCSHQFQERDGCLNTICARCKISGLLEDRVQLDVNYDRDLSEKRPKPNASRRSDIGNASNSLLEDIFLPRQDSDFDIPEPQTPAFLKSGNMFKPDENPITLQQVISNASITFSKEESSEIKSPTSSRKKRPRKPPSLPPPPVPPVGNKSSNTLQVDAGDRSEDRRSSRRRSCAPPPREGRKLSTGRIVPPPPEREDSKARNASANQNVMVPCLDLSGPEFESSTLRSLFSERTSPSIARGQKYEITDTDRQHAFVSKII